MKARIKYFGGEQNDIFDDAFLLPDGVDFDILAATGTELRVRNPDTGAVTIITGTGFTYGPDGTPTGGTVEAATFKQGGSVVARFTQLAWPMADVVTAVDELNSGVGDEFTPLLNLQPIVADATKATNGFIITDDGTSELTRPVTILGSDFNDRLVGSAKSDRIEMGDSEGYDVLFGSKGNDTIDYSRSLVNYQELSYEPLTRGVDVTIDGAANTGSVAKSAGAWGTDVLIDVANPLNAGWTAGGLGIYGTAKADDFFLTLDAQQWMQVGGQAGNDGFVIDTSAGGTVRLNYAWSTLSGPMNGVEVNVAKGKTFDDGYGTRDSFSITQGAGRVEFQLTNFSDTFMGSGEKDRVILLGGNDTADGKGGWDTLRFDRSDDPTDFVQIDLGAGTATGVLRGQAFNHAIARFEEVRGTREGNDIFTGWNGDDRFDGRGGFNQANGTRGNDTYVYTGSSGDYQQLSYFGLARGVNVTIDGDANTGTVVKEGGLGTDTLVDIATPLGEGWTTGGFGLYGTTKGDDFVIDGGAETWMQVGGGAGKDIFDITLSGWVRLDYSWDGGTGPVNGVDIDIGKGKAFDDGFGSRDLITITDGAGRLQLRGTGFDDVMKGSARREDFITEAGDDTVDGKGGDDRIRYDRGGYEAVAVNLGAGTADVTINGTVWTDTLIRIEDARGTRTGDDLIVGSGADNVLQGRGGNDTIKGLGGADEIWGEGDDDVLTGGGAADVFHYAAGVDEGSDRITDFQDGVDLIGYLGGDFADVSVQSAGGGANTRLVFVDGTEVLLKGVASTDIDISDFLL